MIIGVSDIGGPGRWAWYLGPLNSIYTMSFCGLWIVGLTKLFKAYRLSSGELKLNLRNMFTALFLGIIPPTLVTIILPSIGIYYLNWVGPISSAIWVFIIAYSIIKYRQMDVRVVVTEVLAIAMTGIFFLNIFITGPFGILARIATFIAFLILAIYLIRGVLREAKQREELNDLNANLAQKVAEQTVEIRKSYESEKHARLELEKLNDAKDQFIMITQHHLRTPVTGIIWDLEAILSGAHGKVSSAMEKSVTAMKSSADRLMLIVNDFLNITAIKIGTNILNISKHSLKPAIEDILTEFKPEIDRMKLTVSYPTEVSSWPLLPIDYPKMREILLIVLENAARYNKETGSIVITTQSNDEMFELTIENTGIGITAEEKDKIGSSLFYRSEKARTIHPVGMGIGLSVVKAIIKAHHGEFSIESKGKDMGARVEIKLPVA